MIQDRLQFAGARQEHGRVAAEELRDGTFRFGRNEILADDAGELAPQAIKGLDAPFISPGGLRLASDARGQCRNTKPCNEHHRKRDEILRVVDDHRVVRLGKDHVEQCDRHDRRDDRGASPVPERDEHHAQEVGHHQIGFGQARRDAKATRRPCTRPKRAPSRSMHASESQRQAGRRRDMRHQFGRSVDHVDVDVAALANQPVRRRLRSAKPSARQLRLADDDLGHVALLSVPNRFGDEVLAAYRGGFRPQPLGESKMREQPRAILRGHLARLRRFNVDGNPLGSQGVGQSLRRTNQPGRGGAGTDANQQAFARGPHFVPGAS